MLFKRTASLDPEHTAVDEKAVFNSLAQLANGVRKDGVELVTDKTSVLKNISLNNHNDEATRDDGFDGKVNGSTCPGEEKDDAVVGVQLVQDALMLAGSPGSPGSDGVAFSDTAGETSDGCAHSPSSKSSPRANGFCRVCGEDASGNFFGALVCLPCKSFFIRCTKEGDPAFLCLCDGCCDVSMRGRSRCQHCRYEKCLAAGMSRKEKPEAVEPVEGQLLCRVCGDIANGIHFGVYTCEGCKKFFRRGLTEHQSYECTSHMSCTLNPRNRNNCRCCRYQKCLQVGMSRGAIKMGRPKKLHKYLGKPSLEVVEKPVSPGDKKSETDCEKSPHHSDAGYPGSIPGCDGHQIHDHSSLSPASDTSLLEELNTASTDDNSMEMPPKHPPLTNCILKSLLTVGGLNRASDVLMDNAGTDSPLHWTSNSMSSISSDNSRDIKPVMYCHLADDHDQRSLSMRSGHIIPTTRVSPVGAAFSSYNTSPVHSPPGIGSRRRSSSSELEQDELTYCKRRRRSDSDSPVIHSVYETGAMTRNIYISPHIVSNGSPHVIPNGSTHIVSNGSSHNIANGSSQNIPNGSTHITPNREYLDRDIPLDLTKPRTRSPNAVVCEKTGMSSIRPSSRIPIPEAHGINLDVSCTEQRYWRNAYMNGHLVDQHHFLASFPANLPNASSSETPHSIGRGVGEGNTTVPQNVLVSARGHEDPDSLPLQATSSDPNFLMDSKVLEDVDAFFMSLLSLFRNIQQRIDCNRAGQYHIGMYDQFQNLILRQDRPSSQPVQIPYSRTISCSRQTNGMANTALHTILPGEHQLVEQLEKMHQFSPVQVCVYWNQMDPFSKMLQMSSDQHCVLQDMLEAYMDMLKNCNESSTPPEATVTHMKEWPFDESDSLAEHLVRRLLRQIKESLCFMTKVPGFNDFHPQDRIYIIQNMCFSIVTLMASRDWYNPETRTFENDMNWELPQSHPMYNFWKVAQDLGDRFHQLHVDRTEAAMLCALNVAASDFMDVHEPHVIERARGFLISALTFHIRYKNVDPIPRMRELFGLMPAFRLCGFWSKTIREQVTLKRNV